MKPTTLNLADYQDMVKMFHDETDRGAAVLAGSYLENYLGTFLESKMVDGDKALHDRIFSSNGPLSSFSQRIDFAQAFGFLNAHACLSFHLVRKIRNHFAHHPKEASFRGSPVKEFVRTLASGYPKIDGESVFSDEEGRKIYLVTAGMLLIAMNSPGDVEDSLRG